MKLNGTATINANQHLTIGNVDTITLAQQYGTPLMVFDEQHIRNQMNRFKNILEKSGLTYHISYASKAFLCKEMVRVAMSENFGLDVVSIGELYNAIAAGANPSQIHLHGNNKSDDEIQFALDHNIGCFVVDSFDEIIRLNRISAQNDKIAKSLLRITPGVEAHTHEFITTGNADSKFGLNLDNGQASLGIKQLLDASHIELIGVHFHIGSQIFGTEGTQKAIQKVFSWFNELKQAQSFVPKVLNIGGGFGIRYTQEDISYPIEKALLEIVDTLKLESKKYDIPLPQLWLEPGRSIVGEAGYTLYTVGTVKHIPNVRTYVSVDGGMSDHIRTALYGAKYEVALANRMSETASDLVTISGKCCESGDIIQKDVFVPNPKIGDTLVVSCTGAYHYAMASNYNQMQRPAVVFVKDGTSKLVIKRESLDDLIKNQL